MLDTRLLVITVEVIKWGGQEYQLDHCTTMLLEVKYFQVFSPTDRNFMPDIGKLVRWMLGSYLFVCVTPIFVRWESW